MKTSNGLRYVGKPHDRTRLLRAVEQSVSEGSSRLYACVSVSPNFGGSVKAYAVGCELRCGFCWSPVRTVHEVKRLRTSRASVEQCAHDALADVAVDGASDPSAINIDNALAEILPRLFSPSEIVDRMVRVADERIVEGIGAFELFTEGQIPKNVNYFTISGGEPTACRQHLLEVLEAFAVRKVKAKFLLQSHGFILGADPSYLEELMQYRDFLEFRISLKAGSPEGLCARVGLAPTEFDLPFRAIQQLLDLRLDFYVAAMSDPTLMPDGERESLLRKLGAICEASGKTLRLLDDASEGEFRQARRDSVFLEEECYVPVFPSILSLNGI